MSKVIEKVFASQIHVKIVAMMPEFFFGYRPGKSTFQAMAWLLKDRMDNNPAVLVMTNTQNAFASLDHNLLLGMMASFGATELVTTIINQYLKKRTQFV